MTNKFDPLKKLFPDLLKLDKALNNLKGAKCGSIEQIKLSSFIKKIMTEDAELLKRLATNEPLN